MGQDSSMLSEQNIRKRHSLVSFPTRFASDKVTNGTRFVLPSKAPKILKDTKYASARSAPNLTSINNKKTKYVQLYKPIYIALCTKTLNEQFFYDEGDEFELIEKIDEEYLRVIHLRTNTEHTIHRKRLRLDPETPLRLSSADRGVIQRCLFQYNVPGAYLIRRSNTESNAFVLSVAQISNRRNAEDWHYLICLDTLNRCFYFAQESKLKNISFTSFQELIHDQNVLKAIPLSIILPFRIEFEEDLWHIPRRHLTLEYRIGEGEFGEVWRALWQNGERKIPVAVKKLRLLRHDKSTTDSFIREIETMKTLRNNYIVALYGVARDSLTNEALIVTELMKSGDLKKWLKSCADVPDEKVTISFAYDICRGMSYLEQRSRVHRDLSCRNLLMSADGNRIKIADFGLSALVNKDDFAQRKEVYSRKVPIRWTAPEVLNNETIFSIKSDVWSFGIVLIEIWLKGDDPYPGEKEFSSIRALVVNGYVHKKPLKCSNQFYNRLILPCLCYEPNQRPNFKSLAELLSQWNKIKAEYDRLNRPCVKLSS
ncbi:unnamed protein product [Rotaria sp. Silwood2]|nr:unnamed protein product [Rotaria sp. Silwood2]CAF2485870.1 unnamed protein product [Rotaria sp. Silwood2]CAF2717327.1 unnamed protein product [Rotaria sp. Silwood2]CAF2869234.1 unnamed protein product [Rotaria sp. Silwood2]CAF3956810.1 unnamed protein product [Rotaria sp. Silwood2]